MFLFKKKKEVEDDGLLQRDDVRCICTLNNYLSQTCSLIFKDEYLILRYENGDIKIYYDSLSSYGKIINSKNGIQNAIEQNILNQQVLQSPGFLTNNFYTLDNNANTFLYIKFYSEKSSTVHTLLVEYNKGIEKAIRILDRKYRDYKDYKKQIDDKDMKD